MEVLRAHCSAEIVGVDMSQGMLDEARRRSAAWPGDAAVRLLRADVRTDDVGSGFDAVVSFGAFGHFLPADQPLLLGTIFRALRPGGRFVFVTGARPPAWDPAWWVARSFNAAMHVRNAIVDPPFVMFYLLFTLETARARLLEAGFEVEVRRGTLPRPWHRFVVVVATRPG